MILPTWDECNAALAQNGQMDPLQSFIYDNEPGSPHDQAWREQLQAALDFVTAPRSKKESGGGAPRLTKKASALAGDPILQSKDLQVTQIPATTGKHFKGTGRFAQNGEGEMVEIGTWLNPAGDVEAGRLTRETGVPHAVDPRTGEVVRAGGGTVEIAPPVLADPGTTVIVAPNAGEAFDQRPVLGASSRLPQPTHRIA